ncbi:hypothetical protein L0Y47_13235 [Ectopseudomonas composti]
MNRFTAPLKFVFGWTLYFLIFWAVYPLAAGVVHVLSHELFSGLLAAFFAFIFLAYMLVYGLMQPVVSLEELLKPRPSDPANAADAEQVKGRAPGLSEHAPPFGQTEARAERTLEHPPP